MMKKIKILFILAIVAILFICFISLYNHTICPFEGYDKNVMINPENYNVNYEDEIDKFYNQYVEYNKYEEQYNTSFYYKHGKKSLISYVAIIYWYSMESYSYTVSLGDDYEVVKNELLSQINLIKTPIGYDSITYMDNFEINGSIYNEIYMKNEIDDEKIYLEHARSKTYWFSYNDDKKEISFSCVFHFEPIEHNNKEDFTKWLSYQF
jgi:hypothetical protein